MKTKKRYNEHKNADNAHQTKCNSVEKAEMILN